MTGHHVKFTNWVISLICSLNDLELSLSENCTLPICLPVYLSIYLSIYLPTYLLPIISHHNIDVCLSVCLLVSRSVDQSVSIHLLTCVCVCVCVCVSSFVKLFIQDISLNNCSVEYNTYKGRHIGGSSYKPIHTQHNINFYNNERHFYFFSA